MSSNPDLLLKRLDRLMKSLMDDFSKDYILLAVKLINDRQMAFVSFDGLKLQNDPVLKLLYSIVDEIENVVFHPEFGIESHEELTTVIRTLRERYF
jgi:hypothetical protein